MHNRLQQQNLNEVYRRVRILPIFDLQHRAGVPE